MKVRIRKRLPHDVPLWIDPAKADYFVTIACKRRGKNQLAHPVIANGIFETVKHRNAREIWYAHLALLMPDHVHLLLSFPLTEKRVQTIVSKWKEWTAKTLKIEWQRDFLNIAFERKKVVAKRLIISSQTRCERDLSKKLRIGPTFSSPSHGRDSALRCPRTPQRDVPTSYFQHSVPTIHFMLDNSSTNGWASYTLRRASRMAAELTDTARACLSVKMQSSTSDWMLPSKMIPTNSPA